MSNFSGSFQYRVKDATKKASFSGYPLEDAVNQERTSCMQGVRSFVSASSPVYGVGDATMNETITRFTSMVSFMQDRFTRIRVNLFCLRLYNGVGKRAWRALHNERSELLVTGDKVSGLSWPLSITCLEGSTLTVIVLASSQIYVVEVLFPETSSPVTIASLSKAFQALLTHTKRYRVF